MNQSARTIKWIAYEASVLDSLPGKNRCHSRPIVGSSWLLQVKWQSWQENSYAKVMVEDSDFEKAQELMVEGEATDPDISTALIRFAKCGSSKIPYAQMTRKVNTR